MTGRTSVVSSSSEHDGTSESTDWDRDYQTPLADKDLVQIQAFWTQFLSETNRDLDLPVPVTFCFGDTKELANELFELVLAGTKRATAGSVAEHEADGDPLPKVGDLSIIMDGSMRPRLVMETTDVRIGPLSSVDDQFAWDEGEGDRSRDYWLKAHHWYFSRSYEHLGLDFHEHIDVAFERFEVIYQGGATNTD